LSQTTKIALHRTQNNAKQQPITATPTNIANASWQKVAPSLQLQTVALFQPSTRLTIFPYPILTSNVRFSTKSTMQAFIQNAIDTNPILIFSKSYCPYCANTKRLFQTLNLTPKVYELDQMENGMELQRALETLTGQRTVPNVFVRGQHIGGNDDTVRANGNGELAKLLQLDKAL
jgi:glutaredoxin 3